MKKCPLSKQSKEEKSDGHHKLVQCIQRILCLLNTA